jgi:hypothetical protein
MDCINVFNEVKKVLNIDFQFYKVVNIEYGLNCISPIDIKDLITYLSYHERNEFRTDIGLAYSKKSYSVTTNGTANQYKIIKAYAKGLHFPNYTNINTFRFEVKSKKSRYINQLGIYTANDLINPKVYLTLVESLIYEFEKVLILDCATNFKSLTSKEQNKIAKYNNPMEWYRINSSLNRNSFSKNKTTYYKLINKVPNNLKSQLRQIIFDKLELLKKGAYSQHKNQIKKGAISQLYNKGICTYNEITIDKVKTSICKITGLNISMQKDNSILLSHTGLKYYYENDKNTFEQIKREYLSNLWQNANYQTQIKEIAHNIRNTKSNRGIKQNRLYQPQQINFLTQLGI